MPHVVALYRYPVKSFTPEERDELIVQDDGRIAGDRVLAFRFAGAATPEQQDGLDYWPKSKGLALQSFPSLAALRLRLRDGVVRITRDDEVLVEAGLDAEGRARLVDAVTSFVRTTPEASLLDGRLPLVLVGDGTRARFQDRARGYVTVHGRASVRALEHALERDADDRRFRSNVVVDDLAAWEELSWSGRIRIGDVEFTTEGPVVRCLAPHADPDTGVRNAPILTTLTRRIGQDQPTLGRLLLPAAGGGVIRVGDELVVM
ncbi:MOSC domain-containing protein [Microbacterium sp. KR10-403]|uniref:MOSC domain-containing protein n=1 Tax=Microbacterium sp. KR10-403 TaxID=3158581 RepID=UPI0032E384DD